MKKEKQLAKFIEEHLDAIEGYERGSAYPAWQNESLLDYPCVSISEIDGLYIKIATDIINFLKN